ncbi:hypothetical protein [Actinomadura sp. 21ATH]|uniref:hypothetical protein n=1 Tax=Actinomadura sp. 21ATH TaxID=1735444 RepID=UPI0035C246DB
MSVPCPVSHCDRPADRGRPCGACSAELGRALTSVAWLAGELDTTLSRQTSKTGGGRSAETPMVFDPRASKAARILRSTLVGWVRAMEIEPREGPVCAACEHPSCRMLPYSRGPADTCQSMAAWLSAGLSRLLRHPAASEACEELTAAVRAAQRAVDRPGERVFAGRCECGEALYARPGASVVQCRECDAEPYDVADQHDKMREEIRDQLAHPYGAAALLARLDIKAPESTIRRWAKLGRIAAHGIDPRGRPVYRIGDILDVITEMGRSLPA